MKIIQTILLVTLTLAGGLQAERIKDIVDIQGIRGNPLSGTGLVVGLSGTGDKSSLSAQMLTNVLRQSGLVLSPSAMTGGSIAVVMVTAELGPFDRVGAAIDVDVATIGDASSLQGGKLLTTELKGLDGQTYAIAQGGISLGGWSASGSQAQTSSNHPTVGRIASGAIVEQSELADFVEIIGGHRFITLNLRNDDFSTATHVGEAINQLYQQCATVLDPGTVRLQVPLNVPQSQIAQFIDYITTPEVVVDSTATVVINERTGTIVVGQRVTISEVAVAQGSLVVKIQETARVSQPTGMFSDAGETVTVPETGIEVQERAGHLIPIPRAVTVEELANSLNAIGATPRDLIAIFNTLKVQGALQAKLVIM